MPAFEILHIESAQTREPRIVRLGRLHAPSSHEAARRGSSRFGPAPEGYATVAEELPLSRLLRQWQDEGTHPFGGARTITTPL